MGGGVYYEQVGMTGGVNTGPGQQRLPHKHIPTERIRAVQGQTGGAEMDR